MTRIDDSSQPPSPIQRILIFHSNLPEKCLQGESLGEGASLQELSEQIIYYHRDQTWGNECYEGQAPDSPLTPPRTKVNLTEEAVQFVGLCTALYSLPASLGDEELKEDRTNEIYFGNSTLIFIPLESSKDLLAVAQVSRLYQKGNKSESGGGNPLAVRSSLQRCHQLFCMLRGGGILHRLAANPSEQEIQTNDDSGNPYPGMNKLFTLLKQLRRAREQISRPKAGEHNPKTLSQEINELSNEIKTLRKKLPIQAIRRDLDSHYKEFLGDLSVVVSRSGGAGRCLVETVPVPIALDSGSHVFQSFPTTVSTYSGVSLGLSLRRLLNEFSRNDKDRPHLLGVSSFHDGQLLYTHTADDVIFEEFAGINQQPPASVTVSNDVVCLLMSHLASYRTKMRQWPAASHAVSLHNTPPEPRLGLKRLALSFDSMTDEAPQTIEEGSSMKVEHEGGNQGYFVPPPPLFMLSALDQIHSLEGRKRCKVWAPKIHLPLHPISKDESEHYYLDTQVVLYETEGFSFLLFLKCMHYDLSDEQLSVTRSFIIKLEEQLLEAVDLASEYEPVGVTPKAQPSQTDWIEQGQDLLLVDRGQHKLILFSDRKSVVVRDKKKPAQGKSPPRRFLGFGSRNPDRKGPHTNNQRRSSTIEWAALGLDCRHLLASNLHLDTILAFDDMMNEVARLKGTTGMPKDTGSIRELSANNGTLELCTCMPLGWIYAFVDGDKELYAFFDSSIYVTVADVQSAAMKVQKQLIGRWPRDMI